MELGLKGRHVLITGGSKGIGLACAKAFAAEGCNLHLVARDAAQLEAARSAVLKIADIGVTLHPADLSKGDAVKEVVAACGAIDVLVNNAGSIPGGSIETLDEARWREAWDLKVFGYINMTREVLPAMYQRRSGVIVNIIGIAGVRPGYDYICGAVGNAALMAFTRGIGARSTDHGVRVVGVNPAATHTDRIVALSRARARTTFGDESLWEKMLDDLPFGRLAKAEEVADLVVYCACDRASYLSGTVIDVDGGARHR